MNILGGILGAEVIADCGFEDAVEAEAHFVQSRIRIFCGLLLEICDDIRVTDRTELRFTEMGNQIGFDGAAVGLIVRIIAYTSLFVGMEPLDGPFAEGEVIR